MNERKTKKEGGKEGEKSREAKLTILHKKLITSHNVVIEAVGYHQVNGLCELAPKWGRDLRYCVGTDARLIVTQLLVFVALLEHREKLDDIRIVVVELVTRPIEAEHERAVANWCRRGNDRAQVRGVQAGVRSMPFVGTSGECAKIFWGRCLWGFAASRGCGEREIFVDSRRRKRIEQSRGRREWGGLQSIL